MKKIRIKNLLLGIVLLTLIGCKNVQDKKENNGFVFIEGTKKVELIILNGRDYLQLNTPTYIDLKHPNIKGTDFTVFGSGLEMLDSEEGNLSLKVTAKEVFLIDNKLELKVLVKDGEKRLNHTFNIPVKK